MNEGSEVMREKREKARKRILPIPTIIREIRNVIKLVAK